MMRPIAPLALVLTIATGCAKTPPASEKQAPPRPPTAIEPLPRNQDLPPEAADAIYAGLTAAQRQDLPTVLSVVRALTPRAQGSADLAERLATVCRAAGQVDLAWKFARLAVAIAPESPSALLVLSVTESDLDWIHGVPERLRKIKQLAPGSVEPRLALATNRQEANQFTAAEAEYRELIALAPDNPAGWGMLATNLHLQKRYDDARAANDEAGRRGGADDPAVWILSARIDLDQAEEKPDAAEALRKRALDALEAGCARQPVPAALYYLGSAHEAVGDLKRARDAWEKVYAQIPDYPRLRTRLGRLRIRLGDTAGGEKLFVEEHAANERLDSLRRLVNASAANLADPERHRAVAVEAERRSMTPRARLEWQLVLKLKPEDSQAKARLAALMVGVPDVPMPATFP